MRLTRSSIINSTVAIASGLSALFITDLIISCYDSSLSFVFSFNSPVYADSSGLRKIDNEVLNLIRNCTASSDKIKDVYPNRSYKINLYRDQGFKHCNRVKIDFDRDDKWDEKWTIDRDFIIKRDVSSRDDEVYDQKFILVDNKWQRK